MKTIDYSDGLDVGERFRILADEILSLVHDTMVEEYTDYEKDGIALVMRQLPYVLFGVNGELEGKTILDLGCGSRTTKDKELVNYEPWLCRVLYHAGVDVVGVDIANSQEEFEFRMKDVFVDDLSDLQGFDVIHCASLFDSPTLLHMHGVDAGEKLKQKVELFATQALNREGVFLYS